MEHSKITQKTTLPKFLVAKSYFKSYLQFPKYCYFRKLHFGDRTINSMYTVLKSKKIEYEAIGIEMLIDEEKQNVAIITSIMRRSHAMDFSKDIIFVDSSGSCD